MALDQLDNGTVSGMSSADNLDGFTHAHSFFAPEEVPTLREKKYGESLTQRLNYQRQLARVNPLGPPDLFHYGKYSGTNSSQFMNDDFNPKTDTESTDNDGYIGYYHYVDGLKHDTHYSIDSYVYTALGILYKDNGFYWINGSNASTLGTKREVIATFCCYNIFAKAEFRIRYVITPHSTSRKTSLAVDKSVQIIPNDSSGKKINAPFHSMVFDGSLWDELNASSCIRLFTHIDEPGKAIAGTVSLSSFVDTQADVLQILSVLVKFLPRGQILDADPSYGAVTSCGNNDKAAKKSNVYRNKLVDSIIRLCELDTSGAAADQAIKDIQKLSIDKDDWCVVILKILKVSDGSNRMKTFLELIHSYFSRNSMYSTQACLIIMEQIKFLISQQDNQRALLLAEKTITILPLDFECWYLLTICYIITGKYKSALLAINSAPIILNQNAVDLDSVSGVNDSFSETFARRLNANEETISEKTFAKYFPEPKSYVNRTLGQATNSNVPDGYIKHLWHEIFVFNPYSRHPTVGSHFYQSPLSCKSATEISSVQTQLFRLTGSQSLKTRASAYSGRAPTCSILDFTKKSSWGRCYDLISFLVAKIGWDELVRLKAETFRTNIDVPSQDPKQFVVENDTSVISPLTVPCEVWLEQLFMIVYEDLKTLISIMDPLKDQHHSALEWKMLGLLGWNVKFNLKGTISSLITANLGSTSEYNFNYFTSMQILSLYDEFVLSELDDSQIDVFTDEYSKTVYTNKLIVKEKAQAYANVHKTITEQYLNLDLLMLVIMRLTSWNLRWYQYVPNHLVIRVLKKLIAAHSSEYLISKFRFVFEQNKDSAVKPKRFSFGLFTRAKDEPASPKHFVEPDSPAEYVVRIIKWLDSMN